MSIQYTGEMDIDVNDFLRNLDMREKAEMLEGFANLNHLDKSLRFVSEPEWDVVLEMAAEIIGYRLNIDGEDMLRKLQAAKREVK